MTKYSAKEMIKYINEKFDLKDYIELFPEHWKEVNDEIIEIFKQNNPKIVNDFMLNKKNDAQNWINRIKQEKNNPNTINLGFIPIIKSKIALSALEKYYLAILYGKSSGKVKFSYLNGAILQKLLFYYDFERKPVSLFWFNFFWTFNTQKNILMPLVNKKGIYCFYTKSLIKKLSKIIGSSKCLEIASGDGTLTSFLKNAGADINATDDYSWKTYIKYPEIVENIDAPKALIKYKPETVICSWPPSNNGFEKFVFTSESVKTYIVIGSEYDFASGNWNDYRTQTGFELFQDKKLSRLVIPKELDNRVLIFRRK